MTREKEIMQEANTRYSTSHPFIDIAKESFIEGTKWADKTMIEKVCKWLKENIDKDLVIYNNQSWIKRDVFIDNFKKAMEE